MKKYIKDFDSFIKTSERTLETFVYSTYEKFINDRIMWQTSKLSNPQNENNTANDLEEDSDDFMRPDEIIKVKNDFSNNVSTLMNLQENPIIAAIKIQNGLA